MHYRIFSYTNWNNFMKPLKIAVASDLHLEFEPLHLRNKESAQVLVLAGDVLVAEDLDRLPPTTSPYANSHNLGTRQLSAKRYHQFLKQVTGEFPHVMAVAGNHEFYHGNWYKHLEVLRETYAQYPNIDFLEQDCVVVQGIQFIGGTLWTDMNRGDPLTLHATRDLMNDFRVIRNDQAGYRKLSPHDTVQRHRDTLGYFKLLLQNKQPTVVVSHHAPTHLSVHSKYRGEGVLNGAYFSDLSDLILDNPHIKLWAHGHMHDACEYLVGDTRVVCNPRGYPSENQQFELKYYDV